MELLRDIISLLLGIIILVYPLFIIPSLRKRRDVMLFLLATFVFTGILCLILLWWDDYSTWRLMAYYGWNFDGMCERECLQNVEACNRERVQKLWNHNMGVGWPVKAFLCYIVTLPSQWLLSAVEYVIIKKKRHYDK